MDKKFGDKSRRPALVRGADGRVRLASEREAIGDIWAEQKRIRLAEAIKADQLSAEKRKARKALIGRTARRLKGLGVSARQKAASSSKKQRLTAAGVLAVIVIASVLLAPGVPLPYKGGAAKKASITDTRVLDSEAQKPSYPTILPSGKKIEELGGWGRVSPTDRDPVFAYVDSVDGVRITVSEQPLPEDFKDDVSGSVASLAKQFSATDEVTADKVTFYIGTSIKGPQSVIFSKEGLLILVKSDTKLTHQQWADYIVSLQ